MPRGTGKTSNVMRTNGKGKHNRPPAARPPGEVDRGRRRGRRDGHVGVGAAALAIDERYVELRALDLLHASARRVEPVPLRVHSVALHVHQDAVLVEVVRPRCVCVSSIHCLA